MSREPISGCDRLGRIFKLLNAYSIVMISPRSAIRFPSASKPLKRQSKPWLRHFVSLELSRRHLGIDTPLRIWYPCLPICPISRKIEKSRTKSSVCCMSIIGGKSVQYVPLLRDDRHQGNWRPKIQNTLFSGAPTSGWRQLIKVSSKTKTPRAFGKLRRAFAKVLQESSRHNAE